MTYNTTNPNATVERQMGKLLQMYQAVGILQRVYNNDDQSTISGPLSTVLNELFELRDSIIDEGDK